MQGRSGSRYDPGDRSSSELLAAANGNGSGKQRAIPQRPPGMTRVEHPPRTQRVGRPQRQDKPQKSRRRRLLILAVVFLTCGLLAGGFGYALVNLIQAIQSNTGAASTAYDFLQALKDQKYDLAYNDLDASITITLTSDVFKQMALADDRCYGQVTDFNEVAGSATTSADNSTQSYTYTYDVTRSKLSKTYKLTLTLQKDPNSNWNITKYGDGSSNNNDLAPGLPPCS